jgi:DNA (cytosine-5)-methyltransferase 1
MSIEVKEYVKIIKVLNLCAGLGGNRQKWADCEVTAVEYDPKIAAVYKKLYPNDTVIVGDAFQYLLDHHQEFDFVWSSPPCQGNSRMIRSGKNRKPRYPDLRLYEQVIFLEFNFKGKYVIENVKPYYKPLMPARVMGRHLFWSNFEWTDIEVKQPKGFINKTNVKGKEALQEWLGIHYEGNIYYEGNHCPAQILRNCVHPLVGEHIFKAFRSLKAET